MIYYSPDNRATQFLINTSPESQQTATLCNWTIEGWFVVTQFILALNACEVPPSFVIYKTIISGVTMVL